MTLTRKAISDDLRYWRKKDNIDESINKHIEALKIRIQNNLNRISKQQQQLENMIQLQNFLHIKQEIYSKTTL